MQVTFLLSPLELKTARRAYSRHFHSLGRRAQPWLNLATSLILALVLSLDGFRFFRRPGRRPDFFELLFVALWLAVAAIGWWRQRRQREFDPDYGSEQTFELQEDGIFHGMEGNAKVRVPWTKISRFVETEEFFLLSSPWPWGTEKPGKPSLLRKQAVRFILPKRAFNSEDVDQFRDLLQRKLSVWAKNPALKAHTILTLPNRV